MPVESPWRGLGWRLGVGAAAAVVLVVGGRFVNLGFDPAATVALALLAAAGSWILADQAEPPSRPLWQRPQPPQRAAAFLADTRTRRLATVLARAQPGAEFETATAARLLTDLVEHRLDAPPAEGAAEERLSPELAAFLRDAREGRPRPLTRRALHAHLKEIDAL
ncbi:hypothetical protein FOJ82_11420 [Tessaracoccus rhinocerotis]|uniref:Uncharacterized protein n=1 Tax=Tessaracoccus rhinocerotis TaxID=1689449 RepID=A0A553JZH1_9ACTN|nr:hypothetical protein [Tessaracoccus rhinocerotis]TRY17868.1 hypothetical protein FOJ82_11420 [Tessaracoccus rhinocerotis]